MAIADERNRKLHIKLAMFDDCNQLKVNILKTQKLLFKKWLTFEILLPKFFKVGAISTNRGLTFIRPIYMVQLLPTTVARN